MKHILLIVAHPKKESLTMSLATRYMEASSLAGKSVEMIDLYRCAHQQPFFTFEEANHVAVTKEMAFFHDKIKKAEEIAFFFPYWWGSMPAILKNFLDWNLSKGFAFTYENGRPKGLLTGKSVKIFTTTGAPKFLYNITGANRRFRLMFKEQIVEFCGMKLEQCNIYGGVDTGGKKIEKILADVVKRV